MRAPNDFSFNYKDMRSCRSPLHFGGFCDLSRASIARSALELRRQGGPNHWGSLDPAFATCKIGHNQSPIDISNPKLADLPELKFAYEAVPLSIVNNGHTIMINYAPGSTLTVDDKTYTLKQCHFHHPSEERVKGKGFDLVAHLVHSDSDGTSPL
jgi:carbonic anhydrase